MSDQSVTIGIEIDGAEPAADAIDKVASALKGLNNANVDNISSVADSLDQLQQSADGAAQPVDTVKQSLDGLSGVDTSSIEDAATRFDSLSTSAEGVAPPLDAVTASIQGLTEVDTSNLTNTSQNLTNIGQAAQGAQDPINSASQNLQTLADTDTSTLSATSQRLDAVGQAAQGTVDPLGLSRDRMNDLGGVSESTSNSFGNFVTQLNNSITGFTAVAAGSLTLVENYTQMERASLNAERAQTRLSAAHDRVVTLQDKLNGLIAAGDTSSTKYVQTSEQLATAKEREANQTDFVALAQTHANEAMARFFTDIVPAGISVVSGLTQAITQLPDTVNKLKSAWGDLTGAIQGVGGIVDGLGGKFKSLITDAGNLAGSIKSVGLSGGSMIPYLLTGTAAAVGLSAAFAAISLNAAPIHAAFADVASQVGQTIPQAKGAIVDLGNAVIETANFFTDGMRVVAAALQGTKGPMATTTSEMERLIQQYNTAGTTGQRWADELISSWKKASDGSISSINAIEQANIKQLVEQGKLKDDLGTFSTAAQKAYADNALAAARWGDDVKNTFDKVDSSLQKTTDALRTKFTGIVPGLEQFGAFGSTVEAAIQKIVGAENQLGTAMEATKKSADPLNDTIKAQQKFLIDTSGAIQPLIDKFHEMGGPASALITKTIQDISKALADLGTNAEKGDMNKVLEDLRNLDKVSGSVSTSTKQAKDAYDQFNTTATASDAIMKQVAATMTAGMSDQQLATLATSAYVDQLEKEGGTQKALGDAIKEVAKQRGVGSEAADKAAKSEDQYAKSLRDAVLQEENSTQALKAFTEAGGSATKGIADTNKALEDAKARYAELAGQLSSAQAGINLFATAFETQRTKALELETQLQGLQGQLVAYNQEISNAQFIQDEYNTGLTNYALKLDDDIAKTTEATGEVNAFVGALSTGIPQLVAGQKAINDLAQGYGDAVLHTTELTTDLTNLDAIHLRYLKDVQDGHNAYLEFNKTLDDEHTKNAVLMSDLAAEAQAFGGLPSFMVPTIQRYEDFITANKTGGQAAFDFESSVTQAWQQTLSAASPLFEQLKSAFEKSGKDSTDALSKAWDDLPPRVKSALSATDKAALDTAASFAATMSDAGQTWALKFEAAVAQGMSGDQAASQANQWVSGVIGGIQQQFPQFRNQIQEFWDALQTGKAENISKALADLAGMPGPIGKTFSDMATNIFTPAFDKVGEGSKTNSDQAVVNMKTMETASGQIFANLKAGIDTFTGGLNFADAQLLILGTDITSLAGQFKSLPADIASAFGTISSLGQTTFQNMGSNAQAAVTAIDTAFRTMPGQLAAYFGTVSSTAQQILNGLGTLATTAVNTINNAFRVMPGQVAPYFGSIATTAQQTFNNMPPQATTAVNSINGAFRQMPGQIAPYFGTLATTAQQTFSNMIPQATLAVNSVTFAFRALPGNIAPYFGTLSTIAQTTFNNMVIQAQNAARQISAAFATAQASQQLGQLQATSPAGGAPIQSRFGTVFAQHGFAGIVAKPTQFVVGEAGPEYVSVIPGGGAAQVGTQLSQGILDMAAALTKSNAQLIQHNNAMLKSIEATDDLETRTKTAAKALAGSGLATAADNTSASVGAMGVNSIVAGTAFGGLAAYAQSTGAQINAMGFGAAAGAQGSQALGQSASGASQGVQTMGQNSIVAGTAFGGLAAYAQSTGANINAMGFGATQASQGTQALGQSASTSAQGLGTMGSNASSAGQQTSQMGSQAGQAGGQLSSAGQQAGSMGSQAGSAGGQLSQMGSQAGAAGGGASSLGNASNTAAAAVQGFGTAAQSASAQIRAAGAAATAQGATFGPGQYQQYTYPVSGGGTQTVPQLASYNYQYGTSGGYTHYYYPGYNPGPYYYGGAGPFHAASGFIGIVDKPTHFVAGEAGSEYVSIIPSGSAGAVSTTMTSGLGDTAKSLTALQKSADLTAKSLAGSGLNSAAQTTDTALNQLAGSSNATRDAFIQHDLRIRENILIIEEGSKKAKTQQDQLAYAQEKQKLQMDLQTLEAEAASKGFTDIAAAAQALLSPTNSATGSITGLGNAAGNVANAMNNAASSIGSAANNLSGAAASSAGLVGAAFANLAQYGSFSGGTPTSGMPGAPGVYPGGQAAGQYGPFGAYAQYGQFGGGGGGAGAGAGTYQVPSRSPYGAFGAYAQYGQFQKVTAQTGFTGIVTRPTQFTVGEHGSEYVSVIPSTVAGPSAPLAGMFGSLFGGGGINTQGAQLSLSKLQDVLKLSSDAFVALNKYLLDNNVLTGINTNITGTNSLSTLLNTLHTNANNASTAANSSATDDLTSIFGNLFGTTTSVIGAMEKMATSFIAAASGTFTPGKLPAKDLNPPTPTPGGGGGGGGIPGGGGGGGGGSVPYYGPAAFAPYAQYGSFTYGTPTSGLPGAPGVYPGPQSSQAGPFGQYAQYGQFQSPTQSTGTAGTYQPPTRSPYGAFGAYSQYGQFQKSAQFGFSGIVRRATSFLAGEGGPEFISITPTSRLPTPTLGVTGTSGIDVNQLMAKIVDLLNSIQNQSTNINLNAFLDGLNVYKSQQKYTKDRLGGFLH